MEGRGSGTILCAAAFCAASLLREAREALAASSYPALRLLRCEYQEGAIVIRGVVPSYYEKQLAQAALLVNPRIPAVINRVEVI